MPIADKSPVPFIAWKSGNRAMFSEEQRLVWAAEWPTRTPSTDGDKPSAARGGIDGASANAGC